MHVNRQELTEVLESVKPGLANREIIEQTTSFVFTAEGYVCAYNDAVAVSHPTPAGMERVIGAVPEELHTLLRRYQSDTIKMSAGDNTLMIQTRGSRAKLPLRPDIVLPITQPENMSAWSSLPTNFSDIAAFCARTTAKSAAQPILTCLHVHEDAIEASDNFSLIRYKTRGTGEAFVESLLLPATAAALLPRYLPHEVATSNGWAHFRNRQGTIFSTRTVQGTFPNIANLIPKDGIDVLLPSEALIDALTRAEVVGEKGAWGTHIHLSLRNKNCVVEAKGVGGQYTERVRGAEYGGEPITIGISSEFLRHILAAHTTAILSNDGTRMRWDGDDYTYVCALQSVQED